MSGIVLEWTREKRSAYLNGVNWIGLLLAMLAFSVQIYAVQDHFKRPHQWITSLYWDKFAAFNILCFALAALIFWAKRRRISPLWTFNAVCLLCFPELVSPFENYLCWTFVGRPYPLRYHPFALALVAWPICVVLTGVFWGFALIFGRKARIM